MDRLVQVMDWGSCLLQTGQDACSRLALDRHLEPYPGSGCAHTCLSYPEILYVVRALGSLCFWADRVVISKGLGYTS